MRGLLTLLAVIGFVALCGILNFSVMPGAGIAPNLPVIYVPGEHLTSLGTFPGTGVEITNTMIATWLTMLIVFVWIIPIALNFKDVPGRGQAFVEIIVDVWYGFARGAAGNKARMLLPLMLSIFFFLLVANLMKIVPGVDTVGELHCAGLVPSHIDHEDHEAMAEGYVAFSGYEYRDNKIDLGFTELYILENNGTVNTGNNMSFEQYEACHERKKRDDKTFIMAEDGHSEGEEGAGEEQAEEEVTTNDEDTEAEEYVALPRDQGYKADLFAVTPFVRGATTDLSLTLAIAIVAMFMVQVYGIRELGVGGWGQKFINIPALNKGSFIDFAVGLLETFLELAKVVSFAFRLFGAMFGGQILMFVIVFLVGWFVPIAVMGLEVFVGAIQAFVFAILFLMFSVVAMSSHHDDEHGDEHH